MNYYVSIQKVAERINNIENISVADFKAGKDIRKIIVRVVNYENIYYSVKCYDGTIEEYTEQTVPNSIIKLINWNKPIFKGETDEHETTMIYMFN